MATAGPPGTVRIIYNIFAAPSASAPRAKLPTTVEAVCRANQNAYHTGNETPGYLHLNPANERLVKYRALQYELNVKFA